MIVRKLMALSLASALAMTTVQGSSAARAGVLVFAEKTSLRNAAANAGTTVFHGDTLNTEAHGAAQVLAGSARFYLGEMSGATMRNEAGRASATLLRGTAVFSTSKANEFELNASAARIRAQGDTYTVAQVSFEGPNALRITTRKGAVSVTIGDETEILPEAASYRVLLDPSAEADPAPPPQDPRGAGARAHAAPRKVTLKRKGLLIIAIAGGAGVTAFGLHELFESPDHP